MISAVQPDDDEGSLLAPIKQYLGGMKLYQEVFCFNGPVYYFYNFLLRTLTGTPVTTMLPGSVPWFSGLPAACRPPESSCA
jgi:hypothetical protein